FALRSPGWFAQGGVTGWEPFAMCLGATLWSGVSRLVIAATREDAMAVGFEEGPVFPESCAYTAEGGATTVWGGRRDEAASLLRGYRDGGGAIYNAVPPPGRT